MLRPQMVSTGPELNTLLETIRGEPLVAVDTEAASFHRHIDRIYLIQVSSRATTAVIDPLAVKDLAEFGALLADPGTEVVFHDGDYDLRLFDREYGFHATNLFDTRIAAQFLNEPGIGLAALLEKHLGVKVDKRYQRADWSARPLSEEMLAYAATDTHHLPALRDLLRDNLQVIGRLSWCEEEFEHLAKVRWTAGDDKEHAYLRLKGAKALQPRQLGILQELWKWRDRVATKTDRAAFRILGNEVLIDLAKDPPPDEAALSKRKGVGAQTAERRGRELLSTIRRGQRMREKDLPRLERPPRRVVDPELDGRLERLKRARNQLATRLELAPGVLCPNGTLEDIAREHPDSLERLAEIHSIRRWQAATFGKELLEAADGAG